MISYEKIVQMAHNDKSGGMAMADANVQRFNQNFFRYIKDIAGIFTALGVPATKQGKFLDEVMSVVDTRDRTGEWDNLKSFMDRATGAFSTVLPDAQHQKMRDMVNLTVITQYLRPSLPLPADGPGTPNFHRIDTTVWLGDGVRLLPWDEMRRSNAAEFAQRHADMLSCTSKWQKRLAALGPWMFVGNETKKRIFATVTADLKAGFGKF